MPDWYVTFVNNPDSGYYVLTVFLFIFGLVFIFNARPDEH